jgi:hypothetical protein
MNETSACQPGYGIFGIRSIAEFARDLLEAPRPPRFVEQKADDSVVDLVLGETGAAALVWNTLLLHGKVLVFSTRHCNAAFRVSAGVLKARVSRGLVFSLVAISSSWG